MVENQTQSVVALLTRAPSAGGKTRLFRELGRPIDFGLLLALLLDTLDAVVTSGLPVVVFCEPAGACEDLRVTIPHGTPILPQSGGDLGEKMERAFDDMFATGAGIVILVGSDLPSLSPGLLRAANSALLKSAADVIIAPSLDGGYALIGARQTPRSLLHGIVWSQPDVRAQTLVAASRAGLRIVELPATRDVDTVADLSAISASDGGAPRTREWVRINSHLL
jgi:rSAM/selenodomain-associated transferase 1